MTISKTLMIAAAAAGLIALAGCHKKSDEAAKASQVPASPASAQGASAAMAQAANDAAAAAGEDAGTTASPPPAAPGPSTAPVAPVKK